MDTDITNIQWHIKHAVQNLQKKYRSSPFVFLTESDVKCKLYSELVDGFSKKTRANTVDTNKKKLKDWDYQVITIPLHSELSCSHRRKTEYVDLCIIDPSRFKVEVYKKKFSRSEGNFDWKEYNWLPKDSIGIEIKANWAQNMKIHRNGRLIYTKRWKEFEQYVIGDLWKLKKYKRGWLIMIDDYSTFKTKTGWRDFIEKMIRMSNYGSAKKTLNAYYLCPNNRKAWPYRHSGSFF